MAGAFIALLGALMGAWLLARVTEPAGNLTGVRKELSPALVASEPEILGERSPDEAFRRMPAKEFPVTVEPEHSGSAAIALSIVDAETDEPLPHLTFTVAQEQEGGRFKRVAYGTTDENGSASVANLPSGQLRLLSDRREPNCLGRHVVSLQEYEMLEVVMRVPRGGAVSGRVVDDQGVGLPHVIISGGQVVATATRAGRPKSPQGREIMARTNAGGHFLIEALVGTSELASARSSRSGPGDDGGVVIYVENPFDQFDHQEVTVSIATGETVPLEREIVFRSRSTLAGTARMADGTPARGALVTTDAGGLGQHTTDARNQRLGASIVKIPGTTRDRQDHALVQADGSFGVSSRWRASALFLVTPRGTVHRFEIEPCPPGTVCDGLELVVEDVQVVKFKLVRPDGQPVQPRATQRATFVFTLDDGSAQTWSEEVHQAGEVSLQMEVDVERVRAVRYDLPGSLSKEESFPAGLALEELHRVTLSATPLLRLQVSRAGEGDHRFNAVACLLDPNRRSRRGCCGLATPIAVQLRTGTRALELEVAFEGPYWIYGTNSYAHFGPFLAGPSVHTIAVEPDTARALTSAVEPRFEQRMDGSTTWTPTEFVGRIVDAAGVPLPTGSSVFVCGQLGHVGVTGEVELEKGLPPRLLAVVQLSNDPRYPHSLGQANLRAVPIERWLPGETTTVRLPALRPVELRVTGLDATQKRAPLSFKIEPLAVLEHECACRSRVGSSELSASPHELPMGDADERLFRAHLGVGSYRVTPATTLELETTTISVVPGAGRQIIELAPLRR